MELTGQKREKTGKKVKSLRAVGNIPAAVFGSGIDSTSITLNLNEFSKILKIAGETSLIDLKIESGENAGSDATYKVLVKDVQYDPVSDFIIHVGLYKPDLTAKTEVQVPVEILGEENNPAVKSGAGLVLTLINEITVSALPADLPDAFTVDISGLEEVGAGITVGELEYNREKVDIIDLEDDELVVKIDYAEMLEEEEEEEELTEEEAIEKMEATAEGAEEEGEEGETKEDKPKKEAEKEDKGKEEKAKKE